MKKHSKKIQVSIGIPAYNEQANIKQLLVSLLSQVQKNYVLKEIIVYSDSSTDKTVSEVLSLKNKSIIVVSGSKRIGQQEVQNIFLKTFCGDILVIVEADTLPYNTQSIDELVKPLLTNTQERVGMVVGQAMGTAPSTFFEKFTFFGEKLKGDVFSEWKRGNNIYVSGGHAMRALTREFCNILSWPTHVPEDSYAYLLLRKHNFILVKNPKAKAWVKNVGTANDSLIQSNKFVSGKKSLEKYFELSFIESEYSVPKVLFLKHVLKNLVFSPFMTMGYVIIFVSNRVLNMKYRDYTSFYKPYVSTKSFKKI